MKSSDTWLYLLVGGIVFWWLFGRHITASVTVGPDVKIGIPTREPPQTPTPDWHLNFNSYYNGAGGNN